jgi:hypothetical protein
MVEIPSSLLVALDLSKRGLSLTSMVLFSKAVGVPEYAFVSL